MNLSNKGLLLAIASGYCIHGTSATLEQLQLMHFGGRWWQEGETMKHSWGVGSFLVKFRGSSQLKVQLQSGWSAGLYYTCKINDGASFELYHANSNDLSVAANLDSAEEYVVWCGRNNEASYGATILSGVVLDTGGELLQATDPNARNAMLRLEVVGDSISAGFKVTATSASEPGSSYNQNVFKAYPKLLADAWQTTDYQVIAKSGKNSSITLLSSHNMSH